MKHSVSPHDLVMALVSLTLIALNFFWEITKMDLHLFILLYRGGTDNWNPSSSKTRSRLTCKVNTMPADVLVTQGAKASAAMISPKLSPNIPVSALERLMNKYLCSLFRFQTTHALVTFNGVNLLHFMRSFVSFCLVLLKIYLSKTPIVAWICSL